MVGILRIALADGVVCEPEEEVLEDIELDMVRGGGRSGEERRREIGEGFGIGEEEGAGPVREAFSGEEVFDEGEAVDGGDSGGEGAGGGEERE